MKLLISLADFADFTAFSTNIDERLVTPYIREAQTLDIKLPEAVRSALETALAAVQPEYRPEEFDSAEFQTTATTAGWSDLKLARLWYEALRPLLVLEAARRIILWHGTHITPAGLEELAADLNRTPASSQRRAVLSADLQAKAAYYRPLFEAGLRKLAPMPTTGTCGAAPNRRPGRGSLQVSAL